MKKTNLLTVATLLLAMCFAACGNKNSAQGEAAAPETAVEATEAAAADFDAYLAEYDAYVDSVLDQLAAANEVALKDGLEAALAQVQEVVDQLKAFDDRLAHWDTANSPISESQFQRVHAIMQKVEDAFPEAFEDAAE